ncbi:redoxin domain-containing protein [Halobacillus litoralis]|uniref:Redoxin domain-containing protein n=1 Tax=Halobacillus litoralis TaxID=45668 RepID=A0A845FDC9_9BACI|nr:redoxin domain-containing protein [Halobacillus litoralis]MYL71646.1 redoxin domain-containing protein [Halobacillus litoralis]
MSEFRLGDRVPNFILPTITGEQFLLESHQEIHEKSWHLIVFFQGSWSPECVRFLKQIEDHLRDFSREHVTVMAIAAENTAGLKRMADKENFTFPLLADEFLSINEAFGVYTQHREISNEGIRSFGEPACFLINHEGELLYQQKQTGPFGRACAADLLKAIRHLKSQQQSKGSAS